MIADLFNPQQRYLRSTHVSHDFRDSTALDGYIVTAQTQEAWKRICAGLQPGSHARAWRITGDYGSGKSSFALLLAQALSGQVDHLPQQVLDSLDETPDTVASFHLLPVLITCVREPLAVAMIRALHEALEPHSHIAAVKKMRTSLRSVLQRAEPVADTTALAMVHACLEVVTDTGVGTGLLIIMDELGKCLEYAAMHPQRQDVYLLQRLAEAAARSTSHPLLLLGLLHQGFHTYADLLAQTTQREWDKVAGRFEEIVFQQTIDAVATMVADALHVNTAAIPFAISQHLVEDIGASYHLQWYGSSTTEGWLKSLAPQMYPLHPTVLPVLGRIFSRFGQNERSLFSFLLAHEPYGLQDFLNQRPTGEALYCLHHLYDYVRTTFGYRISQQSYRSHWHLIEGVITSYPESAVLEIQILKTIGLLNLLDAAPLYPTKETLALALNAHDPATSAEIEQALHLLRNQKHVLHFRGRNNDFCLWPYTSVNLDRVYEDARQAIGGQISISQRVMAFLETRPLVARRHYIQTGTLRYFEVQYVPVQELTKAVHTFSLEAAGKIVLPLCETEADCNAAQQLALAPTMVEYPMVLIAVSPPLTDLAGLVHELECWQWVLANTPELAFDSYGAEEVQRKLTTARTKLETRLHSSIGLRSGYGTLEVQWYCQGQPIAIATKRQLLARLSDTCDTCYPQAPIIINELVNRDALSSAAAAARMNLLDRILTASDQPWLGMDPRTAPPEMSMYLSVCRETGLHGDQGVTWEFTAPPSDADSCRVRHAFEAMQNLLETQTDQQVTVADLFAILRRPPLGVRDGLIPVLFAIYWVMHQHELALYENGTFLRDVQSMEFRRLMKWPGTFAVQLAHVTPARARVLAQLDTVLNPQRESCAPPTVVDIVRLLMQRIARLPEYTRKTRTVSPIAREVIGTLMQAKEPITLIFRDLPQACQCPPAAGEGLWGDEADRYAQTLFHAVEELRLAYPSLLGRLRLGIGEVFGYGDHVLHLREQLTQRVSTLVPFISEPRLKAFCLRILDTPLEDGPWIEAIGSFVRSKVPVAWTDDDANQAVQDIRQLCELLRRVEAAQFTKVAAAQPNAALRVTLTLANGTEHNWVALTDPADEAVVASLEQTMVNLLQQAGQFGLAAASRAVWRILATQEK